MNKKVMKRLTALMLTTAFAWTIACGSTEEKKAEPPKEEPKKEEKKEDAATAKQRGMALEGALIEKLNQKLAELDPVLFTPFSYQISAVVFKDLIEKYFPIISEVVNQVPDRYVVQVTGFANPAGSAEKTQALSYNRANAVKGKLTEKGISGSKMTAKGLADTDRICPSYDGKNMDDCWKKNRRVIFKVVVKE